MVWGMNPGGRGPSMTEAGPFNATLLGGGWGIGTVMPGITGELGRVANPDVSYSNGDGAEVVRPVRGKTGSGVS